MGFFRSRKPKADDRWASGAFAETSGDGGIGETSLTVAVRSRPLLPDERKRGDRRDIVRVLDDKHIVVLDPDDEKNYLDERTHRTKERRYTFDVALGSSASNRDVYQKTARGLISGVLNGQNGTVFAYGATGSGKTHTMVGNQHDPGLMVLSLRDVFRFIASDGGEKDYKVECSYTEVYNELVYDLLVPNSPALELREDPERGPMVSGLTHVAVDDENAIFELLRKGNARRKTEETGANAVSSRSHAVLEIWVTRTDRNHYCKAYTTGKLALVDLAGAERASETNNRGHQLRDGANINRSLLSLANCINALGKRKKKGFVFVPFRDSKLTRILKDGLCGNSRTVMVATVSGSSHQYEHTVNTLKYADRAKEIKTHVHENRGTVETHIAEYQRMIDALQEERRELRAEVDRLKGGGGGGDGGQVGGPSKGFVAAVNGGRGRESGGGGGGGDEGSGDAGGRRPGQPELPESMVALATWAVSQTKDWSAAADGGLRAAFGTLVGVNCITVMLVRAMRGRSERRRRARNEAEKAALEARNVAAHEEELAALSRRRDAEKNAATKEPAAASVEGGLAAEKEVGGAGTPTPAFPPARRDPDPREVLNSMGRTEPAAAKTPETVPPGSSSSSSSSFGARTLRRGGGRWTRRTSRRSGRAWTLRCRSCCWRGSVATKRRRLFPPRTSPSPTPSGASPGARGAGAGASR
mmetsp:Transcript_10645/g.47968  ORF Transcript_10645/g.47968 Transcript_10645/m.47968 type:complete len:700 (+) Transcript_10645:316-2415(+)